MYIYIMCIGKQYTNIIHSITCNNVIYLLFIVHMKIQSVAKNFPDL
jgi:hypothetical protein